MLAKYYILLALFTVLMFGFLLGMLFSLSDELKRKSIRCWVFLLSLCGIIICFCGARVFVKEINNIKKSLSTVEVVKELTTECSKEKNFESTDCGWLPMSEMNVQRTYIITENGKKVYLGQEKREVYEKLYPVGDTLTVSADNYPVYGRK